MCSWFGDELTMTIRFSGTLYSARQRVDFSKIKTSIPIPNLIEVQKKVYERFLQMDLLPNEARRLGPGERLPQSVFPDLGLPRLEPT
jgi:DNA-directed RNA polymerase beta subunit